MGGQARASSSVANQGRPGQVAAGQARPEQARPGQAAGGRPGRDPRPSSPVPPSPEAASRAGTRTVFVARQLCGEQQAKARARVRPKGSPGPARLGRDGQACWCLQGPAA